MKQLHEKFEGEGFKATPLEARTGEGGGGREMALLKNALNAHVVLEFLQLPTMTRLLRSGGMEQIGCVSTFSA
ncbi:unnamed protein product [Sphagnum jensenii]|uniref:Uncharacterized protein n=1 Tax=Sphagnum jensenii TaxID=128206 RepID=A0ABP1ABC8_9BRYO